MEWEFGNAKKSGNRDSYNPKINDTKRHVNVLKKFLFYFDEDRIDINYVSMIFHHLHHYYQMRQWFVSTTTLRCEFVCNFRFYSKYYEYDGWGINAILYINAKTKHTQIARLDTECKNRAKEFIQMLMVVDE